MLSKFKLNQLYFKDTQFADLMKRRIFNVLLVANPYDAFMLEDDGRIDEKIFNEYASLSLSSPPRFTQATTCNEALEQLASLTYDLVICMPGTGETEIFDTARRIKQDYPQIPIVILTPFSHGVSERMANEDLSAFEYVFCWLGNTDLLVSIIKLIEDKMNLEHDVNQVGVQVILLVEDEVRFYSSVLPNLYKFVLQQSQEFSTEALNAHQRTLRMRGRPKIILARTYDEAYGIYEKYKNNLLGVITDVRFPKTEGGSKDGLSGIVAFNASSFLSWKRLWNSSAVVLDFFPDRTEGEIKKMEMRARSLGGRSLETIVEKNLAAYILKRSEREKKDPVAMLKNLVFHPSSSYGFNDSQVTHGGVVLDDVDLACHSRIEDGVGIIGEALNVDGKCGGYNLTWALATAYLLATSLKS